MELAIKKVLILMRHANRAGGMDSLSPEGHKQAEAFPKVFEAGILKHFRRSASHVELCCSPKLRTQQTLRFLRDSLQTPIQIRTDLDERTGDETQSSMEARVKSQLAVWTAEADSKTDLSVTVACSHLDWLEAAALIIDSDELELHRAEPWPPLSSKTYGYQHGIWRRFA